MATPAQIAANRRNAQKSTGPTSVEGLAKSSQNRRTHGLCGKFAVLSCESQESFDEMVVAFREAEQPANAVEDELVLRMAKHSWCADRALRMQNDSFEPEEVDEDEEAAGICAMGLDMNRLEAAMRYHTFHERAYRRASEELRARRKQRHLEEIGFERQKLAEAEAQRKSEKHAAAAKTAELKNQLLEIRVAKTYVSELGKIKASQPPQETEFEFSSAENG